MCNRMFDFQVASGVWSAWRSVAQSQTFRCEQNATHVNKDHRIHRVVCLVYRVSLLLQHYYYASFLVCFLLKLRERFNFKKLTYISLCCRRARCKGPLHKVNQDSPRCPFLSSETTDPCLSLSTSRQPHRTAKWHASSSRIASRTLHTCQRGFGLKPVLWRGHWP